MTFDISPPDWGGPPHPSDDDVPYESDSSNGKRSFRRAPQPEARELPNNAAAEASVLGGILIKPGLLPDLQLEVDDFYDPRHKAVFAAMRNLEAAEKPIDLVMLATELERADKFDVIGGMAFLGELALNVPTADNVAYYADLVHDDRVTRELMLRAGHAIGAAGRRNLAGYEAVDELIGDLGRLQARRRDDVALAPIAWAIGEEPIAPVTVYSTPYPDLDDLIGGGLSTRSTTIVVGRTGAGKSGIVIGMGVHAFRVHGVPFLYSSSELDRDECFARIGANVMNVPHKDVYFGKVRREETIEALRGLKVHVLDRSALRRSNPIQTIRRQIKQLADHYGVMPITCVDYLQDLIPDKDERSVRSGVTKISGELRDIGSDMDTAMVLVSSTGRAFYKPPKEGADDPLSYLASAKESGDVEYAASNLLFLDVASEHSAGLHKARIAVAKARRGSRGFVGAMFDGPSGRWFPERDSVRALNAKNRKAADEADAADQEREDDARVFAAIAKRPMVAWNTVREGCGVGKKDADRAKERLLVGGKIEAVEDFFQDQMGRRQKRMVLCVKNAPALPLTTAQPTTPEVSS